MIKKEVTATQAGTVTLGNLAQQQEFIVNEIIRSVKNRPSSDRLATSIADRKS